MKKEDPKQIITPYAFEVDPSLLGLPLATPKRRLLALLLDLLLASILTALGSVVLAAAASILFFWLAIRSRSANWWRNTLRYGAAAGLSVLVFIITISVTGKNSSENPELSNAMILQGLAAGWDEDEWEEYGRKWAEAESLKQVKRLDQLDLDIDLDELSITDNDRKSSITEEIYNERSITAIAELQNAIDLRDSAAIDSLSTLLSPVIAYKELENKENRISALLEANEELVDENEDLRDEVENPSFSRTIRAAATDFGLSVGWVGVYFVMFLSLLKGQTPAKKLLRIRVVRLNNKPLGLWYSFERFGGYAAGLATGLLGFIQIYWDANRQGIHDKIAGTVVIDQRKSRMQRYEEIREKIRKEQNLLD